MTLNISKAVIDTKAEWTELLLVVRTPVKYSTKSIITAWSIREQTCTSMFSAVRSGRLSRYKCSIVFSSHDGSPKLTDYQHSPRRLSSSTLQSTNIQARAMVAELFSALAANMCI